MNKWVQYVEIIFLLIVGASTLRAQSSFSVPFNISQSNPPINFSLDSSGTLIETANDYGTPNNVAIPQGAQMVWVPNQMAFRLGLFYLPNVSSLSRESFAFGDYSDAGPTSASFGSFCFATGSDSFCAGNSNLVAGLNSVAFGDGNNVFGSYAGAIGSGLTVSAFNEFAVGNLNVGGGTPTYPVSTDPLFEIGNGTYDSDSDTYAPSDALVVYRNGNATFRGVVQVSAGGDIPMYTGN